MIKKADIKQPLPPMGHDTIREYIPPREAGFDVYRKFGERVIRKPGEPLVHPAPDPTPLPENVGRRRPLNSGMKLNFHDKPIKSSKLTSSVTGKKTEGVIYKIPDPSHDGRWAPKFEDSAEYLSSAARFMEQLRVDRVYAVVRQRTNNRKCMIS